MGNVLVLGCFVGVLGLAGESYFRFVAVETDAFGVSLPARRWFALHTRLNTEGFRDVEWSAAKAAGVRRVAFVGDSFTYGWGVADPAERFTDRIGVRFRGVGGPAIEVLNVARPGWDTGGELSYLDTLLGRFGVDEVVLGYVLNDIEDLIPRGEGPDPTRPPVPVFFNIDSSPLLDHLYRTILLPREPSVRGYHAWLASGYADARVWEGQFARLQRMADLCRGRGVGFRVVLLPYLGVDKATLGGATLHAKVRTALEGIGVDVVDMLPVVAGEEWRTLIVNPNDAHPNAQAHALFANAIWDAFYAADTVAD